MTRPLLITFSGLDGAGKSTLIAELAADLRARGQRVRVLTMYDDVSIYALVRAIRDRVRSRAGGDRGRATAGGTGPLYAMARSAAARRLAFAGDLVSLFARRLYHQVLRGETLILDRYLYDTLADAAAGGWPSLTTLLRLTPVPDVPILVDVEPEQAFARKGEYDIPYLTERRRTYAELFARIEGAVTVRNDEREAATGLVLAAVARPTAGPVKPDADAALRLLLGRDGGVARAVAAWDGRTLAAFERVLRRNVVLVRTSDLCRQLGAPVPRLEAAAVAERARIDRVLETLAKVGVALEDEAVEYVLTKALQHVPDMGHDMDLFVGNDLGRVRAILERAVGATPARGSVVSRFAGKDAYEASDPPTPLEVHGGRLGHFGEHADIARALLAARRRATITGLEVWVPSPEDQLLLQVIQRVQAHRHIRVSDVLVTLDLWGSAALDRERVLRLAEEVGILGALRWYLAVVNGLAQRAGAPAFGDESLPEVVPPPARSDGYAVPLGVTARTYASAALADLRSGDLESAGRIAVIPALAVATLIDRMLLSAKS
ncbi:MAG TPA: hypothetical protein VMJ92_03425 [Candidatus Limnocylindrales bacterium]|nr:hypothetical protein [Candidatus Limnocylindrales bacterium]